MKEHRPVHHKMNRVQDGVLEKNLYLKLPKSVENESDERTDHSPHHNQLEP
jgi:hypothetical protein